MSPKVSKAHAASLLFPDAYTSYTATETKAPEGGVAILPQHESEPLVRTPQVAKKPVETRANEPVAAGVEVLHWPAFTAGFVELQPARPTQSLGSENYRQHSTENQQWHRFTVNHNYSVRARKQRTIRQKSTKTRQCYPSTRRSHCRRERHSWRKHQPKSD